MLQCFMPNVDIIQGKTGVPGEKSIGTKDENKQQTQPTWGHPAMFLIAPSTQYFQQVKKSQTNQAFD